MSWSNPTPNEAAEEYSRYKKKYNKAVIDRNESIRLENKYITDRNLFKNKIGELSTQRLNSEKRLEGIEKIIKMLEGTGSVPSAIFKAVQMIKKTDESFRAAIKMDDESGVSIEAAFKIKSVEEDIHSASALQTFKSEKYRLEQSIVDLKNQILDLSEQIETLSNQIKSCNALQSSLKSIMNSCAYEMNHYKRHMN